MMTPKRPVTLPPQKVHFRGVAIGMLGAHAISQLLFFNFYIEPQHAFFLGGLDVLCLGSLLAIPGVLSVITLGMVTWGGRLPRKLALLIRLMPLIYLCETVIAAGTLLQIRNNPLWGRVWTEPDMINRSLYLWIGSSVGSFIAILAFRGANPDLVRVPAAPARKSPRPPPDPAAEIETSGTWDEAQNPNPKK